MKFSNKVIPFASLKPEILMLTSHLASQHSLANCRNQFYRIAGVNTKLTGNPGFWFKQEYFGIQPQKGTPTKNHLLHKSLKDEMEGVWNERLQIIEDLAKATLFCKYALRCASNLSEYLSLLPEQFGKDVGELVRNNTGIICESPGYPEEFINIFKAKYAQEEQGLKNQLVYNLLQG